MSVEPKYKHDCDRCEFLGRLNDMDLYACPGSAGTTYLMRYASEGSSYYSHGDFNDVTYNRFDRDTSFLGMDRLTKDRQLKRTVCITIHASMIAAQL